MNTEVWVVSLGILFLLLSLYRDWLKPTVSFVLVVSFFVLFGVLTPKEVLQSFANEQLAIIVLLLLFSDMLRRAAVVDVAFDALFQSAKNPQQLIVRMLAFLAPTSAFLNNTPLVAMMMPYVYNWSGKNKQSISKVLMPLSFIAILGGCMTLIGTSTNLIVNGLAVESGLPSLEIFDFLPAGFAMLVVGGIYLLVFADRLLPDKKEFSDLATEDTREFFIEMRVEDYSVLHGKTVEEAGLRSLENLYLFEIFRKGKRSRPVSPKQQIYSGDKLVFNGNISAVNFLKQPIKGLSLPKKCELPKADKLDVIEVVISHNSPLSGKKIMESNFRGKFDAAIIAMHRNGEKLDGKLGERTLMPGDVLMLLVGNDFFQRTKGNPSFYILSRVENEVSPPRGKALALLAGLVLSIFLSVAFGISLLLCLLVLLGITLVMEVIPNSEIRKGVDFNLIILMTMGLALGKGMMNSGLAQGISNQLVDGLAQPQPFWIFLSFFLVTNVLSSYITNKAAVAILFPIAMLLATAYAMPYQPFVIVIALGAAASFITPIGYQTNLMVYGPGGYSFKDFMRLGLPLTLLCAFTTAAVLTWQIEAF